MTADGVVLCALPYTRKLPACASLDHRLPTIMQAAPSVLELRLNWCGAIVLIIGLAAAAFIYVAAEDSRHSVLGYEIVDGKTYEVTPDSSKRYVADVERFGGKSAVIASDLADWFDQLWHGERLAYTIGTLSIAVSLLCFYVARLFSGGAHYPDHPD